MIEKDVPEIVYKTFESLSEYINVNEGYSISYNHFLELVSESCDYRYTKQEDLDVIIHKICDSCKQISWDNETFNLEGLSQLWKMTWPVEKKELEKIVSFKLEGI